MMAVRKKDGYGGMAPTLLDVLRKIGEEQLNGIEGASERRQHSGAPRLVIVYR